MTALWSIRLALHIGLRHKSEDFRYVAFRKAWSEKGKCYFEVRAFFNIFMLQGFFALINNGASLFTLIYSY